MSSKAHEMIETPEFKALVAKRWGLATILTIVEFVVYYGYILLIGLNKQLLATKIGEATTLGIPMGVGVIIFSFILTYAYVVWANNSYDPEVARLKELFHKGGK